MVRNIYCFLSEGRGGIQDKGGLESGGDTEGEEIRANETTSLLRST